MLRGLGVFLASSGYNSNQLTEELDLHESLYANYQNLEPLLMKTAGDTLLSFLARLFFVGWPVDEAICARLIPAGILAAAIDSRLLNKNGGQLQSQASIIPFRNYLIACDNICLRGGSPDVVTGPGGTSTQFLARLAIGGNNETTLDIGSGSGVLAVQAAAHSRQVTGTDINARSIPFANMSAALNGVCNANFMCGDAFQPVSGQRFTRILANPPFFLSPAKKFIYCDSPLALDGFAQRLATECPQYLEEGGYFQMICQWADLENYPWEQRLRDWTNQSDCDILVLLAPRLSPVAYAEIRTKEALLSHNTPPEFDFTDRVKYLLGYGVKGILSGVINMRKRAGGRNWFSALKAAPAGSHVGPGIRARFESLTFLSASSESEIFATRFRFASDVQLETISEPAAQHWVTSSIELVKSETLTDRLRLDRTVSVCLPLIDGQRTLSEVAQAVSETLSITQEDARVRCSSLARRLLQSSFIVPSQEPVHVTQLTP